MRSFNHRFEKPMLFGFGGSAPSPPPVPPLPPEAPPPPTIQDQSVIDARAASKSAAAKRSRGATIYNSGGQQGLNDPATTTKKSLLGS